MCVCVGQTEAGEGGARKGEEMEENLGQTRAEPHLKRRSRRVQPVKTQHGGSGQCCQPMGRRCGRRQGGPMEVCQLHNQAPPLLVEQEG